jgi:hypothetical protein
MTDDKERVEKVYQEQLERIRRERIEKKIEFDGMAYDRASSQELRSKLIELRDEALKQADFEWAVNLSHVIAWMACVIDIVYSEQEKDNGRRS